MKLLVLCLFAIVFQCIAKGSEIKPEGWCGTEHGHISQVKSKAFVKQPPKNAPFPCAEGKCDDPRYRDDFKAGPTDPTLVVRLYWVVVDPRKSVNQIESLINDQVVWMNEVFAPAKIMFNVTGTKIITNDTKFEKIGKNDYSMISQFKNAYTVDPSQMLHIYVSELTGGLLGRATFPWNLEYFSTEGGLILHRDYYGKGENTLTHEIGHCLGLWHTHHGWENSIRDDWGDIIGCSICDEHPNEQSDFTGDLCSDTKPTVVHYYCNDPSGGDCNDIPWGKTDYDNFMGYAPDSCYTSFTPQQISRMRCWLSESAFSLLDSRACINNEDCNDNNVCTEDTCIDGVCYYEGVVCPSKGPCTNSFCTSNGCVTVPRTCTPRNLPCAVGVCDNSTDRCLLKTASCKKPEPLQDCCTFSYTPYCNSEEVYNCVCAMEETCCTVYWHSGCVDLVKYCTGRDCLKEKLPIPTNTLCNKAKLVPSTLPFQENTYSIDGDRSEVSCDGVADQESGVWYLVYGTGRPITVSTCFGQTTGPTSIRVFMDPSESVCSPNNTCVVWVEESEQCGYKSTLTFVGDKDQRYKVFVSIDSEYVVSVNFYEPTNGNFACPSGIFKVLENTRGVCPESSRYAPSEVDAQNLCLSEIDCVGYTYNEGQQNVDLCNDPNFTYHAQQGYSTGVCVKQ